MRYHLDILKDLENYFRNKKLTDESAELEYQIRGSATSGELLGRVGGWLLQYRKNNAITDELNTLISEFINNCHANGSRFHSGLY